jgi:hypothetical protein
MKSRHYHAFSARPTLRDKPTQKTRIIGRHLGFGHASMGMFTSVIVPGYLHEICCVGVMYSGV